MGSHSFNLNSKTVLGLVLIGLAGVLFGSYAHIRHVSPPTVKMTVFIHGTVGGPLNFLGSSQCSEAFDPECYNARAVALLRNHELIAYDQIVGAHGLHAFKENELPAWHAAGYLIPAYHDIAALVETNEAIRHSYVFGWSGYLHHGARRVAAYELYQSLCAQRDELRDRYGVDPEITIIGYSHGGNVGLWLARAEEEHQRGLSVHQLVMFGTPMHKEMAPFIASNTFTNVVIFSSQGDKIQTRDYFSNRERKSYARMADIADIKKITEENKNIRRTDVHCLIGTDPYHITHINMWLAGRSNAIFDWMNPLPLFIMTPLLLHGIAQHNHTTELTCALLELNDGCAVAVNGVCDATASLYSPRELRERLSALSQRMLTEWKCKDDTSRDFIFNRKNWQMLTSIIWG